MQRARHTSEQESDTPVATTNDLKNGLVLNIDGQLWTVIEFQHVKPGKGPAFVRTKLKNVLSGKVVDKTFNAGVKVETANVDKRDMQYLYHDGDSYVFMDTTSYDQIPVSDAVVGGAKNYLLENQEAVIAIPGGLVSDPATFNELLSHNTTVWLFADPQDHMSRVVAQGDMRPMAASREAMEDLKSILAGRAAFYSKSQLKLDTSAQPLDDTFQALRTMVRELLQLSA